MREKFSRFMQGRYGQDQLGRFLMAAGMVSILLHIILSYAPFYFIAIASLLFGYYRMLSRDFDRRRRENSKYLELKAKLLRLLPERKKRDPYHRIFKCPGCGQKVRVPKGRGKVSIRCHKCGREFIKRT
jgi:ribosomal protein S27E